MYFSMMKMALLRLIRKHLPASYLLLPLYIPVVSFTSCQKSSAPAPAPLYDSVPVMKPVLPIIKEI
jgi:hypothetical protein